MTLAIVYTRAIAGIRAPLVTVEAHLSKGLPRFNMVGLPEAVVKESKDRVRSALINSGFTFPRGRITVNLAPADLPKEGSRFDLPIALGILAASGQLAKSQLDQFEFIGELALSGELRGVFGILPVVLEARQAKRQLIIPAANSDEAGFVQQAEVYSAKHLLEICAFLQGVKSLPKCESIVPPMQTFKVDLADVRGQLHAKRALEVAAAGKHNLLFIGPPGTGKTMLASRLPTLLPEISEALALEIAAIASIGRDGFDPTYWLRIPFRTPHHSSSAPALVGGGRPPKPGEISLAHGGILFLDELPEFNRQVLESLREPLESGAVTISRAACQVTFPASFQLVAAMNPCPCGYAGSSRGQCRCTSEQVARYWSKLSGPLLDRIDMQIEVPSLPTNLLSDIEESSENSTLVKKRVMAARERQWQRQGKCNQELLVPDIQLYCRLCDKGQALIEQIMQKFDLSARAYHRILRVARTIADLEASELIKINHLSEAIAHRAYNRSKYDQCD